MGLEITVAVTAAAPSLAALTTALGAAGLPAVVVMVDNVLQQPGAPPPAAWRDVRVRTPAGTVTLLRRDAATIAVVVFGNADAALQDAQRRIAAILSGT